MWDFDGRTWRGGDVSALPERDIVAVGAPIRYAVTLEPHNLRWLFAIDLPAQRLDGALQTQDYQLLAIRPVRARMRYEMSSHLDYHYGSTEPRRNLARALQLPGGFNPRSRQLAAELRSRSANDRATVEAVLALFRDQPYYYTLVPPELGRDSVDEFLFDTRRGFCEHFAGSFVFLMRAAGVPARVVTGYQGGVLNPIGNYLIVRQSEAHAWAEVWLGEEGWVRVDPTAAVSPLRIEAGIAGAVPAGDPLPLLVRTDSVWLRQLRFTWDAASNGWNQWVLGYNPERQLRMFQRAGIHKPNWQNLVIALTAATGLAVLVLAAIVLRRLRARVRDPVVTAWLLFSRKLEARGLPRAGGEGPLDYARRIAAERPSLGEPAMAVAQLYANLRYGPSRDARAVAELARRVRAFRAA
jgi:transglutaminase-like putative cysteine protease